MAQLAMFRSASPPKGPAMDRRQAREVAGATARRHEKLRSKHSKKADGIGNGKVLEERSISTKINALQNIGVKSKT
jgi:hypothetical protein